MRGHSFFSAAALAATALMSPTITQAVAPHELRLGERATRRQRKAISTDWIAKKYRSRGVQAKPKKRPNRNLISKRVRRKHRRAA